MPTVLNLRSYHAASRCRAYHPSIRVIGGDAGSFHLVAPPEVEPGEPFQLRLSVLDSACNAATGYESVVELTSRGEATLPSDVEVAGSYAEVEGCTLHAAGFHRIYAIDPNRGIVGVSNPIRARKGARNLYWGELHAHSEQSDGVGTPDEHYTYGRDVALLDFGCVCDHDLELYQHPDRWRAALEKVREYSEDGRFVALLGYEGRLRRQDEGLGDINVYYRTEAAEMLERFDTPDPIPPELADDPDCIVVPHTPLYGKQETHMGTDWSLLEGVDPGTMPLVEVFSTHGNSEYYDCPRHLLWQDPRTAVIDALEAGFRLGLIGSSDYHEVLLGSLLRIQDVPRTVNNRHMQARCGLVAVAADGLTREAVFDALRSRRTLATSGIRGYVDSSINGHGMGTELTLDSPNTPRRLSIAAAASERIVHCEVVRDGDVFADVADGNWFVETAIEDDEPIQTGSFYYLRVTTERTELIWSSPVWVDIG